MVKKWLEKIFRKIVLSSIPELYLYITEDAKRICYQYQLYRKIDLSRIAEVVENSVLGQNVKLYGPQYIDNSTIGDYSYIASNSHISKTNIGKFCSIGPNFVCGWGIHPTEGLSTSPMFYSTIKQNGFTLSQNDKIQERKPIYIGNDVFIGANVTVLDGVTIGDGAVIGAGTVVSKNVPPYAIVIGVPMRILRYRMSEHQVEAMSDIQWWNFPERQLAEVEKYFFEIDAFIEKYK